ncbi:response regulator transcription factor [Clostridium arbusti]|uniref:response regulator transcription factor n=1 Tax=Clostridium arbusti TaxID=1137848 RepID=UPI0002E9DB78|nr:response regulator [Clostridium arbusti]
MCNTILVDDEWIELEALKKIINKLNIKINIVGTAQNGKKAVEINGEIKPDIIIIDNEMPGMNGIEVSRIIKEKDKNKIIILLVEYYNFNNKIVDLNIDDYILKPINPESLSKVLNKHIISLVTNENKLREKELLLLYKIISNEEKDIKDLLNNLLYGYELLSNGHINIYKDECISLLDRMINSFIKMKNENNPYTNINLYNEKLNSLNNMSKINMLMNEFLDFMYKDNYDDIVRKKLIGSKEINKMLDSVMTYISENYNERITLESAANSCNISVFYLSRLFKKNTGMKFIDYINLYKNRKG